MALLLLLPVCDFDYRPTGGWTADRSQSEQVVGRSCCRIESANVLITLSEQSAYATGRGAKTIHQLIHRFL